VVLSDEKKKAVYDKYGEEGLKGGMPTGGEQGGQGGMPPGFSPGGGAYHFSQADAANIFAQFFGSSDPFAGSMNGGGFGGGGPGLHRVFRGFGGPQGFAGGFGSPEASPMSEVPPMEYTYACTLEEIHTGCVKKFNVSRQINGREDKKLFEVKVEPGYKKGTKVRFEGEGGNVQGYPPNVVADIVFILDEKPHVRFERQGANLKTKVVLNLKQALLGTQLSVKGIDGKVIAVPVTGVTNPGRTLRVSGEGLLDRKTHARGDLYVELTVQMPKEINDQTKRLLEQCNF